MEYAKKNVLNAVVEASKRMVAGEDASASNASGVAVVSKLKKIVRNLEKAS